MESTLSSNVKGRLFFDSKLGPLALVALLIFVAASIRLAFYVDIDFFDSHNFLLQARRLTDSDYSFYPFDSRRPRTLVMFFTFFNLASLALTGGYPSLTAYQLLMVGISTGFVVGWLFILRSLWGSQVAYLSTLFLLLPQISIHYAPFLLSDMVAGFGWALMFLSFLWVLKQFESRSSSPLLKRLAAILGVVGCIAGLTKNHFSLLVFSILFIFYFAYLFLPVFRDEPWGTPKQIRKFVGWVGLFYVLAIEFETRVFGYLGEGTWEHFRHLYKQAQDQTAEAVVPSLYVENFWLMMGPLFCILGLISLVAFIFWGFKKWPQSRFVQMGRICVLLVSLMYLMLTQMIAHKEVRYLLPQLPGLFVILAVGALLISNRLKERLPWAQNLWLFLWAVSFIHPLTRSVQDYQRFFSSPIYSATRTNSTDLWDFLKSPTLSGQACTVNYACRFDLTETPFELKDDPYYRRHDYEPQFTYFSARPTYIMSCPSSTESKPLIESMMAEFSPSIVDHTQCFILREQTKFTRDRLAILKTIAWDTSAEQEAQLKESYPRQRPSSIDCMTLSGRRVCFLKRTFFNPEEQQAVVR